MRIFRKVSSLILDAIEVTVIALAMFVVMYLFLFQPHQVRGNSMYPNLHDNDYLLTDKITYQLREPKRGDTIIFRAPKNEEYDYIKRIVGLPGDTVRVNDGKIYVNDELLTEDYLSSDSFTYGGRFWKENQSIPVPEDQYFVLGDNRSHSSDSREWGPVPRKNIIGKAWLRYWPPEQVNILPQVDY